MATLNEADLMVCKMLWRMLHERSSFSTGVLCRVDGRRLKRTSGERMIEPHGPWRVTVDPRSLHRGLGEKQHDVLTILNALSRDTHTHPHTRRLPTPANYQMKVFALVTFLVASGVPPSVARLNNMRTLYRVDPASKLASNRVHSSTINEGFTAE